MKRRISHVETKSELIMSLVVDLLRDGDKENSQDVVKEVVYREVLSSF